MSVNNTCQGCLSKDRRLTPIGKYEKLYQLLILTKSNSHVTKQCQLCWECHKVLQNIHAFRLRITKAQKVLKDMHLEYKPLSNLTQVSKVNDFKLVIYEDVKDSIPIEFNPREVKQEVVDELYTEKTEQECDPADLKESFDALKAAVVKYEDDNDINDDVGDMIDDTDITDDKNIKSENEPLVSIEELEKNPDIVVKKVKRKLTVLKQKYRTIIMEDIPDKRKFYEKVKIDQEGVREWMEKKRKSRNRKQFLCERCYCGFSTKKFYDRHLAVRHAKRLGNYECDICGFRFSEKYKLAYHVRSHFLKFVCKLCGYESYARNQMYIHFVHGPHGRQRECKKCGLRFDCRRRRDFFEHFRRMHETHICDYCGQKYRKKCKLVRHIKKYHTIHRCDICNTTYKNMDSYNRHQNEKHVIDVSEQNYCVECNMQFINSAMYNTHLKHSVKHRAPQAIPCPECGKTYAKKITMTNHYKLVHLKKSDYHCAFCDTYYLNGFRLRYHQKYFHEKRPKPKNKLCKYCGKGFSAKCMLENHIRTHTGERPFVCTQCPAAFTQKQALVGHNNRILENHIRTHTGERPFVCSQCPAAFTQKQSLTGHVRTAHK